MGVSRRGEHPTGVPRGRLLRWSRLPGPRTPRPPCRLQPPTSTPQTGTPPSRTLQTGQSRRRALLSRPDQIRVRPMRAPQTGARRAGLVGVSRARVHPMGAHRAGLPRRRRLGPGGPRRLLRRRCLSRRPARSGLPRPQPPSNQPNQPSTTSQASRVVSRAGQLSQASQAGRFGLVGRVCRVGVLLERAPQVPRGLLPGLRPPRVSGPAREQAHLLPRPAQRPRPGRHSRRRVAAPPVVVLGTLPVVVLVGAARTPRPRPVPGLGPRPVRPVPPPLAHARGPRTRSRPAWPPPATPNETAP